MTWLLLQGGGGFFLSRLPLCRHISQLRYPRLGSGSRRRPTMRVINRRSTWALSSYPCPSWKLSMQYPLSDFAKHGLRLYFRLAWRITGGVHNNWISSGRVYACRSSNSSGRVARGTSVPGQALEWCPVSLWSCHGPGALSADVTCLAYGALRVFDRIHRYSFRRV